MPLHSDYLAPTFLLTLIFVQIIFIIYFNVQALRNYGENQKIYLTGTDPQCSIENIPELNKNNVCSRNGNYFVQTPENTFIINKVAQTNISVCSPLCTNTGASINKNGDCSKSVAAYTNCLQELTPITGCKQASKPLAKLKVSDTQTVYYYAQKLVQNSNDC